MSVQAPDLALPFIEDSEEECSLELFGRAEEEAGRAAENVADRPMEEAGREMGGASELGHSGLALLGAETVLTLLLG